MTDVPPIAQVSELVLFIDDLGTSLRAYIKLLGFNNPSHVVHHNGEFGEDEIALYSAENPAIVFSVGGGKAVKSGGEIIADLTVSIFVLTRDYRFRLADQDRSVTRDVLAVWIVGELLRFALRRNDWTQTTQGTKVPAEVTFANLYTPDTNADNVALWGVTWSHSVVISYQRDVSKLDAFSVFNLNIANLPVDSGADSTTLEL